MPDWLQAPVFDAAAISSPWHVLARIAAATAMGGIVAWIHTRTSKGLDAGGGLAATLVLLAGLIAMVTQVIGDNVARAFSLVGALSIVRFRTVVRDTRDTAFVIFSVAVGMAIGAQALWVALMGTVVVGAASFLMAGRTNGATNGLEQLPFVLRVRMGLGFDVHQTIGSLLAEYLEMRELQGIASARQGIAIDYVYGAKPVAGKSIEDMVKQLTKLDGVQEVRWQRRGQELE